MLLSRRSFLFLLLNLIGASRLHALSVKGVEYMSMRELARACGMRSSLSKDGKTQIVYSKFSRMEFRLHSRQIELNGVAVWLGFPVVSNRGALYIAKRDYLKTIVPILFPQRIGKYPKVFHVFLDAGHGGKDVGAQNKAYRLYEKSIALDVVKRLGTILRRNGYRVSFSRTSDKFVELSDRAEAAVKSRADLFLSVHCNAASPSVSGVETFAMTPRYMPSTSAKGTSPSDNIGHAGNASDGWSQLFSYYVQRDLLAATRSDDRGVKRARFAVLRGASMPSSLVEIGFLSNNAEARKLASASYRQRIAQSLANSIMKYHSTIRRLQKS